MLRDMIRTRSSTQAYAGPRLIRFLAGAVVNGATHAGGGDRPGELRAARGAGR